MAGRPKKLPRFSFSTGGSDALTKATDTLIDALEWCRKPSAVLPLKVDDGPNGPVFKLDQTPYVMPGRTSSYCPSGTVPAPGSGTFTVYQLNGSTGITTGTTRTFWNICATGVNSGADGLFGFDGANWWVLVVHGCGDLG